MKRLRHGRLRTQRRSVRKIYLGNFILAFLILIVLQVSMIYLLRVDILIKRILDDRQTVFFFSTVCMMGSFLLVYYMLRELFRSIDRLNAATKKVAKGDYTVHLESGTIIAEIQDTETNFNRMVDELNSVEMLRKDFIADVSHEFKTPLSSITGYITLLQDPDLTPEERREYVQMAIFNAEKLNDLTTNILRLSRLENQSNMPAPTTYRLDEQIREAIVLLERQWNPKDIQLDIELPEVQYFGYQELLLNVWTNLISNAIKFSSEGGQVHVHLTADAEAGTIAVTIRDHGIGMDEKTQAHIFEKFYQGDTSRRAQGNGLGLPLCREIIRRCSGEIQVSSEPGAGSSFTVSLPYKQ